MCVCMSVYCTVLGKIWDGHQPPQQERGHASCFTPQRWSPEAGQRGTVVRRGYIGPWHSHNTSGICDVTLHLWNEISFSNYNTPPHTFKFLTMVWPLKSSPNLRLILAMKQHVNCTHSIKTYTKVQTTKSTNGAHKKFWNPTLLWYYMTRKT